MASYFEIYDDQENKTICVPGKPQIRKETRSVLGEISQNTRKPTKRITKSDGYQVFSENSSILQTNSKNTHHTRLTCHNTENLFPIDPIAETSQGVQECLEPSSPILVISDNESDEVNCSIVSLISYDSNVSSVFQDTSIDQWSLPSVDEDITEDFLNALCPTVSLISDDSNDQWSLPSDENVTEDFLNVPEYSEEIHEYLKGRACQVLPNWNYMERQADITFSMRAILVDWLVEVAEEYNLHTETIYLAVSYIDRFLSRMSVERAKLQLVGTACMFIAAKYEEIYPPGVGEFSFITDNTFTKKQVLRMEDIVLKVLDFDVSVPTSHQFVNHYCQMFRMDEKALHLAQYLNELSLLDGSTFMKFPASVVAASSVVLARHTLSIEAWSDAMADEAGYSLDDLKESVVGLFEIFVAAPDLDQQTIRGKYKHAKFNNVADVSPVDIM